MKPITRLIFALCALVLLSRPVQAQWKYTVNNGEVTITGGSPSSPAARAIPATILRNHGLSDTLLAGAVLKAKVRPWRQSGPMSWRKKKAFEL